MDKQPLLNKTEIHNDNIINNNIVQKNDIIIPNRNYTFSPASPRMNDYLNNTDPNILNPIPQTSSSNKLNILEYQKEKEEFAQTQKYINYLKTHLDSSYYAFNEIKNKNILLLNRQKTLNNELKKNNILYQKLLKSIEAKKKENDEFKIKYEKILENKMKSNNNINNSSSNNDINIDEKIEKMKQKNLILNKENKSKENIILNLKKTLEILEKNKNEKNKEKVERINELKNDLNSINKLKIDLEDTSKQLYIKTLELEKTKKTMEYLIKLKMIKQNESNNNVEEDEISNDKEEKEKEKNKSF